MIFGAMQTPIATGEAAIALIPQRPPFVLVDTLISATSDTFRSAFTIPEDHVLVQNGSLLEAGLMENAAQTAALGMGHTAAQAGAPPPLGFIGALGKATFLARPAAGTRITTTVIIRHEVMNARVLEATVDADGTPLAHLEMKVFIIDPDPSA